MKMQTRVPLSKKYDNEDRFSEELAEHLDELGLGRFEDSMTQVKVGMGNKTADIVATASEDETLVIENQFGKADWDHWGRLEMYARLKDASVAVLVAEEFEDAMIETCRRRNEDSEINTLLIKVEMSSHEEFSFQHLISPPMEKKPRTEEFEFWRPIRDGEYGDIFVGKPMRDVYNVAKRVHGRRMGVSLHCIKPRSYVRIYFRGRSVEQRRRRDAFINWFKIWKIGLLNTD